MKKLKKPISKIEISLALLLLVSSMSVYSQEKNHNIKYQTISVFGTSSTTGSMPGRPLFSHKKLYGSQLGGGTIPKDVFLQRWGRLFITTSTEFETWDARDIQGHDIGQGVVLEYVSPKTGTIYGWRPYMRAWNGYEQYSRPEQSSGILKWVPGAEAPEVITASSELGFSPRQDITVPEHDIPVESGVFSTTWTEDEQGNIYIPGWGSGLFKLNAQNDIQALLKTSRSSNTPTVPDASMPVEPPKPPPHIICFSPPMRVCIDTTTGQPIADPSPYYPDPDAPVSGPTYEYWPYGSHIHAAVYSQDQGGTLYILAGAGDTFFDPASNQVNNATKWIGAYPNSSIPSDDSAGAALLALKLSDITDDGTSTVTILQSLARERDGKTTYEASGLIYAAPNTIVEVGDYIYGTTNKHLWRYKKSAGPGGAIEHVHEFLTTNSDAALANPTMLAKIANNTSRPYGPMVLAKDGWLYGTSANRIAGIPHPQSGEYVAIKDYGTIFRIRPGHTTVEEDSATFEIVHRMSILEGTHPVGLSIGLVTTKADGSHIQTLFGANQWGGYARFGGGDDIDPSRFTPASQRGSGSIFALEIPLPTLLKLNATQIDLGASSTLSWDTSGLNCIARSSDGNFSGAQGITGNLVLTPKENGAHTYELDCKDAQGRTRGDAVTLQVGKTTDEDDSDNSSGGDSGSGGGGPLSWPLAAMLLLIHARFRTQVQRR